MQDYHLPFEYITVQDVRQAVSHHGQTLSLMDACGFFLCQRGSVEVSIDDKTFNIHQGDVYFYMPSTFVCVLKYSDDVEGIAVRCDLDFVLPLVEQSFDGGNVLAMREEPCISLTPEQQQRLEQLANLLQQRLRPPLGKRPVGSGELLQRLVFSLAQSLFHELLYDYACNQSLHPESRDGRDRGFQTFLSVGGLSHHHTVDGRPVHCQDDPFPDQFLVFNDQYLVHRPPFLMLRSLLFFSASPV